MADRPEEDFDVVRPNAAAMIESLRAYGYTLNTAVSDLIDNSISAEAKNIWINFEWAGQLSRISILDDGCGMDEDTLRNAMRPGSQNPLDHREERDLGRFGLGLKTASFSQARSLTVASTTLDTGVAIRRWDLDYVAKSEDWNLLKSPATGTETLVERLAPMRQGTLVVLTNLDRVIGDAQEDDEGARREFLDMVGRLNNHLAMVFHRFLEPPNPLKMYLNGDDEAHRIRPWDPFLRDHMATRRIQTESSQSRLGTVEVEGFVLPHKDRIGAELHSIASGPGGWNDQQGFYVYRKKRLLVAGSWLGLGGRGRGWTKEEHYKLARIRVDIPGSLDSEWDIDVKKSNAKPPHRIKGWLQKYASDVRQQARQVFSHRGAHHNAPARKDTVRLWKPAKRGGNRIYQIDRSHPLIKSLKDKAGDAADEFMSVLRVLEETVPVERIWLDMAEKPDESNEPLGGLSEGEIMDLVDGMISAIAGPGRKADDSVVDLICKMDGFSLHSELIRATMAARGA